MKTQFITSSQARQNFRALFQKIVETGQIFLITVHGKPRVAMIDIDLLDEIIENVEFGISSEEIRRRAKEPTLSLEDVKTRLDV